MSKGKRYEEEPKLNLKKVFVVILAIVVLAMSIYIISGILKGDSNKSQISTKSYFTAFNNNKWGVINSNGETVIEPSYEEMIIIPNSKKDVFLCVYDVNYETGEYKTKALNSKNEEIFTQYEQIEPISNRDENNNIWHEQDILKVQKDGKYGAINLDGKELVACQYEEITVIEGTSNIIKVKKDGKYGILNDEGKEILPTQYVNVINLSSNSKNGFIVANEQGKYGIVDFSNNQILELKYDEIMKTYGNDMYVVKLAGNQILVNKAGEQILATGFDEIKQVMKNTANGVIYVKNSKYGVMSLTGEVIIPAEYDELKETKTGILIAKKDGKYGIIDMQNAIKLDFIYTSLSYNEKADIYIAEKADFTDDIVDNTFTVRESGILLELNDEKGYMQLKQNEEKKFYNFKFEEKNVTEIRTNNTLYVSKKDGKYGFIDKDGKVIVDYNYDDVTEQNSYGYAGIKKDGKWGVIDINGNIIQEPTYNLDDYLQIDFIGRWHLGKDINMNYYNQL